MNELSVKIEALLFVATKPMTTKQLAKILNVSIEEVSASVAELTAVRNIDESGVHVIVGDEGVQLVSNPKFTDAVSALAKEDIDSELTRPSLETLTIVAYRGPMTKPEIEAIRGVNCTLILRNLLVRGLITEEEDSIKLQAVYALSNDALRYLGLHDVKELTDYDALHGNNKIDKLLETIGLPSEV
jgi:segregation and condensation protein B